MFKDILMHIISILLPLSTLPALGEPFPCTSSWQSGKHFLVSCLMTFNRAVDTHHSTPVTPSKTLFVGRIYISWEKLEVKLSLVTE